MKKKNLTRKLIIACITWLTLICCAAGAYFWLDSDITYLTEQTQQKKSAFEINKSELENIAKNIKSSETAMERFDAFSKSDDNNKDLFRKRYLVQKLAEIKKELRAVDLKQYMGAFETYKSIPSSDKVDVIASPVEIEFAALTDVTAFKILELISEKFNGTVYFKGFTIEKIGEINREVLLKVSEGHIPFLVSGKIQFDWISIRLKEAPNVAPAEAAPNGAPVGIPGQPAPVTPPVGGPNV